MKKQGALQAPWLPRAVIGILMLVVVYLLLTNPSQNAAVKPTSSTKGKGGVNRAQEVISRFHHAKEYVSRMKTIGKNELFTMTTCPEKYSIGFRTTPGQVIPEYVGNTCEPWIARFALIFLDRLLDTEMAGLEWSTGSSTQWVLMRVKSLISIEHHAKWSKNVAESLAKIFDKQFLAQRWELHAVEPLPGTKEKGPDKEDPIKFKDYIEASFLPKQEGTYDYISVDGRARVQCFKRALPLLKPEGGVLMLDNSEREWYADAFAAVPKHWLMFEDLVNTGEKTTIWVSCVEGRCGSPLSAED
eukprot:CAMPEP_0206143350 /NCGR_PEP_ID=MMETSP1473-20131121/20215_1 /ASSEMBLY_ACC=CAM_ASM_001109 /TAXON_ID=1461547 /ORGANISM="Stichococcus sp, Strain RCC1054" /LENGTH=300 /DNA_ID=CAMNT_0053538701 /DNA_START=207 /DNA_END=1109 /DNA_ORIENTATION=-